MDPEIRSKVFSEAAQDGGDQGEGDTGNAEEVVKTFQVQVYGDGSVALQDQAAGGEPQKFDDPQQLLDALGPEIGAAGAEPGPEAAAGEVPVAQEGADQGMAEAATSPGAMMAGFLKKQGRGAGPA